MYACKYAMFRFHVYFFLSKFTTKGLGIHYKISPETSSSFEMVKTRLNIYSVYFENASFMLCLFKQDIVQFKNNN